MNRKERRLEAKRAEANAAAYALVAEKAAGNESVCATLAENGAPLYFLAPLEASDDEIQEKAFARRHGRPMSGSEKILRDYAQRDMHE